MKYLSNLLACWCGAVAFTVLLPCVIVLAVPLSILTKDGVEAWGAVGVIALYVPTLLVRGLLGLSFKGD